MSSPAGIEAPTVQAGEVETFRAELRTWLENHLTPEVVEAGQHAVEGNLDVLRAWNRTLADGGWAAPSWPAEYGGRDAGVPEQLAYMEETSRLGAPGPVNVIGVSNIAPAIMQFGTSEQQERFLQTDAPGRRDLVAGDVRARRRFGPGLTAHRRSRGRRRLRDQRAEDLELPGPSGGLVPALRADGPDGQEARRHHLLPGRSAHARHRGAAAHHHHRRRRRSPSSSSPMPASPAPPCSGRSIGGGRWP